MTSDRIKEEPRDVIKRINRTFQYVKDQKVSISFPKIGLTLLRIFGSSDASFGTNSDMTSQVSYIILLIDETGTCAQLQFRSYNTPSVVCSALAAELMAFAEMIDASFTLAEEIRAIHPNVDIPVKLHTHKKILFYIISKGTITSEYRLIRDISAARELFRKREIPEIGFFRTAHNFADGLNTSMG